MAIVFACKCGQQLQAKDEHAGKHTRCPKCGCEVPIPAIEEAPEPEVKPRPEAVMRRPRPDVSHLEEDDEREKRPRSRRRREPAGTSGAAIFSLVLGLLSFCLSLLAGIPAIILGLVSLSAIRKSDGRLGGKGLAIGGIILGTLGTLCSGSVGALALMGVPQMRTAAARAQSQNNLAQCALAMHNYNDTYNRLPPAVVYDRDGKPLYSWRVLILPYLDQDPLYRQFHLDEAWDSPHNSQLLSQMPKVYAPPGTTSLQSTMTYYQVFDGPGAAFDSDKSKGLRPFPMIPSTMEGGITSRIPITFMDGTSNTILIAEGGEAVPWSKPVDLRWDPKGPLPKLGGLFGGDFHVAMADASRRKVPKNTPEATIRAMITANGGEILNHCCQHDSLA